MTEQTVPVPFAFLVDVVDPVVDEKHLPLDVHAKPLLLIALGKGVRNLFLGVRMVGGYGRCHRATTKSSGRRDGVLRSQSWQCTHAHF
jgi:hypothetical protein